MKVVAVPQVAVRAAGQALRLLLAPLALPLFVVGRALQCVAASYTSPAEERRPSSIFPQSLDEATAELLG